MRKFVFLLLLSCVVFAQYRTQIQWPSDNSFFPGSVYVECVSLTSGASDLDTAYARLQRTLWTGPWIGGISDDGAFDNWVEQWHAILKDPNAPSLSDGEHYYVLAYGVDEFATSTDTDTVEIILDKTPPVVTITFPNTGFVHDTQNIYGVATDNLAGIAAVDIYIYRGGTTLIESGSATLSGTSTYKVFSYEWDVPAGDPEGTTYLIRAIAYDNSRFYELDYTTGLSDTHDIWVVKDSEAPSSITLESPGHGGWVGRNAYLKGTVTDALAGVDSMDVEIYEASTWTLISTGKAQMSGSYTSRTWEYWFTVPFYAEGTEFAIVVDAYDRSYTDTVYTTGNSLSEQFTVYLDTIPPVSRILDPEDEERVYGTITVSGIAYDETPGSGVDSVQIKIDAGTWQLVTLNPDSTYLTWTYTLSTTLLSDGPHTLTTRAFDKTSPPNIETPSETITIYVDNSAPVWTSLVCADPDNIYKNGEWITLIASLDDTGYTITADFSTIDDQYVTGSEIVTDNGDNTYTIQYMISTENTTPNGTYTITVTATDFAGRSTSSTIDLMLDNSGPQVTFLDLDDGDNIINAGDTLRATITDNENNLEEAEYFVDAIDAYGSGIPMIAEDGAFDELTEDVKAFLDISSLAEGYHKVYVHGKDTAGVWGPMSSLQFLVDRTPPVLSALEVVYPDGQSAVRDGQTVKVKVMVEDEYAGVDSVWGDFSALGAGVLRLEDPDGDHVYEVEFVVNAGGSGDFTFTVYAVDIVPNEDSVSGSVTVDNTLPVITSVEVLPDSILRDGENVLVRVVADASGYDVHVDFSQVDDRYISGSETVADSGSGVYRVSYTISEDNEVADGAYPLYVSVYDAVGNGAFDTVYVTLDNSGPVVDSLTLLVDYLHDYIINVNDTVYAEVSDDRGVVGAEFFVDNTGYDGDGISMTVAPYAGTSVVAKGYLDISSLTDGVHRIYVHALDTAGVWGAYRSFEFIVDREAPEFVNLEVVYPDGQYSVKDGDQVKIKVEVRDRTTRVDTVWVDATALGGIFALTDANGDNVYEVEIAVNTGGATGDVSFTVYASDPAPNTGNITGTVLVDNTAPVFISSTRPDNETGIYRNGDRITIITRWDGADYTIKADFSGIDANYVAGSEQVTNNGDSTYTIVYQISEDNNLPNSDSIVIPITATDDAGNTTTDYSYHVALNNMLPVTFVYPEVNTIYKGDVLLEVVAPEGTYKVEFMVYDTILHALGVDSIREDGFTWIWNTEDFEDRGDWKVLAFAYNRTGLLIGTDTITVGVDNTIPAFSLEIMPLPEKGDTLNGEVYRPDVIVKGWVHDNLSGVGTVKMKITNEDGELVNTGNYEVSGDTAFSFRITLEEGVNILTFEFQDKVENTTTHTCTLTYVVPEVTELVGPEGGTVELADGTRVEIPEGALNERVMITIKKVWDAPPVNGNIELIGTAHLFGPEGLVFRKPVTVVLPYTHLDLDKNQDGIPDLPEDSLVPFYYDGTRWLRVGDANIETEANRVMFTVNHFTLFDLGVDRRDLGAVASRDSMSYFFTRNPLKLRDGTSLVFFAPSDGTITVRIYDLAGDLVAILVKDMSISRGEHTIKWDGRSQTGRFLGSGIYIYRIDYTHGDVTEVYRGTLGVIK